jgi:hypothetical protein
VLTLPFPRFITSQRWVIEPNMEIDGPNRHSCLYEFGIMTHDILWRSAYHGGVGILSPALLLTAFRPWGRKPGPDSFLQSLTNLLSAAGGPESGHKVDLRNDRKRLSNLPIECAL